MKASQDFRATLLVLLSLLIAITCSRNYVLTKMKDNGAKSGDHNVTIKWVAGFGFMHSFSRRNKHLGRELPLTEQSSVETCSMQAHDF